MKFWLKIICILLLAYSVTGAFLHPLIPGGLDVSMQELHPGRNEFVFTGYNTHFIREANNLKVYVASGKTYYRANVVEVADDSHILAVVELPEVIPSGNWSFFVNNLSDGTIYVEKAIQSSGFIINEAATNGDMVSVQNNEHQGFGFPFQIILYETIRNMMFHVPMWFTMFALMIASVVFSIVVLYKKNGGLADYGAFAAIDAKASVAAGTGLLFCVLGLLTGSIWARFTWGTWWTKDPQLNGALAVFIVYAAYFVLRNSLPDLEKKARLSAIFNIFACVLMIVLLMVMPRFAEGLHPGKSGNPAFSKYDLDSSLRTVFYPAVAGWVLLGFWINSVRLRIHRLEHSMDENVSTGKDEKSRLDLPAEI
ncbi:MAG: cytochrome c biogenesis protein CcsA [Crocinitomicaceae bacterium]|nr:cytochrome c biogenesis protein CcsA [Crocinitomicaceae bacterium]